MKISKKIGFIVVGIWIIFSVIYICRDAWQNFITTKLNQAYQPGRADTINALIQQAESSCQPFSVFSGEKQIQLINGDCLSKGE